MLSAGDIRSSSLFNRHRVGINVAFADLDRSDDFRSDILEIATHEGYHRALVVSCGPGMRNGQIDFEARSGDPVRCRHISALRWALVRGSCRSGRAALRQEAPGRL